MDYSINILIVEDEVFATRYLHKILNSIGFFNIDEATNADNALNIVKSKTIDLIFMDINIAGAIDGIKCAKLVNEEYFIPIIFTTAYGDRQTIKEANESNIFGYLIKPFEENDVEASLSVALKMIELKSTEEKETIPNYVDRINLGNNQVFNLSSKTLFLKNKPIDLTKKELELLNLFCININNNISYETLKDQIWNSNVSNSTIRDTISRLKRKIKNLPLENIINYGYVLKL